MAYTVYTYISVAYAHIVATRTSIATSIDPGEAAHPSSLAWVYPVYKFICCLYIPLFIFMCIIHVNCMSFATSIDPGEPAHPSSLAWVY
ncbi:MAG: hypothetical protein ABW185_17480, partial [Sedimenticola sp.]